MRLPISLTASLLLVAPLALVSSLTPTQVVLAETKPDPARDFEHFYVGVDGSEVLETGDYAGLKNPNYNRLTFLFAHVEDDPTTNHFHSIGAYSYSDSVDNPVINSTNANNRIPETYTGLPPLTLQLGTGVYADRLVSSLTAEEYSNIEMEPVSSLQNNEDPGAQYLFNSSSGRWSGSLGDAVVGLELVAKSSGLNIADEAGTNILTQVGDTYTIGSGDNFAFTPTFWTDASAPIGTYSATFRLQDLGTANARTPLGGSGTFSMDYQVVPEPSSSLGLIAFGLLAFTAKRRLKRTSREVCIRK
jgi:hypothetical protein